MSAIHLTGAVLVTLAISIAVACVQGSIALTLLSAASKTRPTGHFATLIAIGLCVVVAAVIYLAAGSLGIRASRIAGAALLLLASGYMAWQLGLVDDVRNGGRDVIALRPPSSFAKRRFAIPFWGGLVAGLPVAVTWAGATLGGTFGAPVLSAVGAGLCAVMGAWLGRRFARHDLTDVLLIIAITSAAALGEYRLINVIL